MVRIKFYVEGGNIDQKANAATMSNTVALRQSLSQLLNDSEEKTFQIECEMCGSYTAAIQRFRKSGDQTARLLIDLDKPESERAQKIAKHSLESMENRVFFMVREMEAWFISQANLIENCLIEEGYQKRGIDFLADDERIKDKLSSEIPKPSIVWANLIPTYFIEEKNGVQKPLKYGKLKNAPLLIRFLDINQLKTDFIDVENILKV